MHWQCLGLRIHKVETLDGVVSKSRLSSYQQVFFLFLSFFLGRVADKTSRRAFRSAASSFPAQHQEIKGVNALRIGSYLSR
jgi:hypothetical protein